MADHYGAVDIPTTAPLAGEISGDPLLTRLLKFLFAYLVTDNNATAGWNAIGGGEPLIRKLFENNPVEGGFSDKDVPALFAWRSEIPEPRQIAADFRMTESVVTLQWVFPPVSQERQRLRKAYGNALAKDIDAALQTGRTPSYVVAGDTDAQAAYLGSFILEHFGAGEFYCGRARWLPLVITSKDVSAPMPPITYDSLVIEITFDEYLVEDLAANYDVLEGVSGTVTNAAAPSLQVESFLFDLEATSVSPNSGTTAGGTNVTVNGQSFMDGATVSLGGLACTNVVVVGPTQITCTTPAHGAGLVACTVLNPNGDSDTLANAYTYA